MPYVYSLASKFRRAIYVGCARDLRRRVEQHRARAVEAHTAKHGITILIYFEAHDTIEAALLRERRLKRWHRAWKDELVEEVNPTWSDLSHEIPY